MKSDYAWAIVWRAPNYPDDWLNTKGEWGPFSNRRIYPTQAEAKREAETFRTAQVVRLRKKYTGWAVRWNSSLEDSCRYFDRTGLSDAEVSNKNRWPYSRRGQTFATMKEARHSVNLRRQYAVLDEFVFVRRFRWVEDV